MRGTSIKIILMLFGIHSVFILFHSLQADYGRQLTGTPRRTKKRQCRITHTSGHDYLDAERASCLMSTHWHTVSSNRHHRALSLFSSTAWCGSSSSTANTSFPGLGFEPQSKQFFRFFLSSNFLQRSIDGEYFSKNFIHWLIYLSIWVVIGVTSQKIASTGIRTPDLEIWNLM